MRGAEGVKIKCLVHCIFLTISCSDYHPLFRPANVTKKVFEKTCDKEMDGKNAPIGLVNNLSRLRPRVGVAGDYPIRNVSQSPTRKPPPMESDPIKRTSYPALQSLLQHPNISSMWVHQERAKNCQINRGRL